MAITSAIVPYQPNQSTAIVKPQQSMSAIVPVKKEAEKKTEVTARDLRAATLRLLRKRQQRDRLESKYYKLEQKLKEKKNTKKEEKKNESKSFLGSVGSAFRSKAQKVGGDLLGSIGNILGYLALDWLSKPENQSIVKTIVSGVGAIFKFVEFWVTSAVDNLLSGFSQFVGGDTILERVLGFFQMAAGFFGLKYFLNPQSFFKDIWKAVDFIKGGGIRKIKIFLKKLQKQGLGKAFKFAFPKLSKVVNNILGIGPKILKGIKGAIGKTGINAFFDKITNSIIKAIGGGAGKQAIKKGVGALIKPVTGILKRVPVVGGLLSFGLNMLLGDPPDQAFVKASGSMLGSAIGAGLGSFIFPGVGTWIGGLVGGLIGDWLGDRLYDMLKGGDAKPPTNDELKKLELKRLEVEKIKKLTGGTERALTAEEQNEIYRQIAEAKGMSPEKVKALLEQKETTLPEDDDTSSSSSAGLTISTDVAANIAAIKKAAKEMNYTGDMAALLAIAKGESGIKGIPEQPITSAQRASEIWSISRAEAQQLLDSGGWRALYNEVYGWSGNSLGNRPGTNDGSDFIGRGFIQITGRHNYKDIGDRIGVDFMSNPELLLDKDIAVDISASIGLTIKE